MGANKKVMKIVIAVLALCLLALAQTPPRPNFSEQFSANIGLDVKTPTGHFYGEGTVAYDYTGGRAMEALHYNNATMDTFDLKLYPSAKEYTIHGFGNCSTSALTGKIGQVWGWLAPATYQPLVSTSASLSSKTISLVLSVFSLTTPPPTL